MNATSTIATLRTLLFVFAAVLCLPGFGQKVLELDAAEYDRRKAAGIELPARVQLKPGSFPTYVDRGALRPVVRPKGGGGIAACDLWQDPTDCTLAFGPHDDLPSLQVNLPFTFNLYGTNYNSLWINNNGNVTFDAAYGTFSANPFPNNAFVMIAPFWGDVDTGDDGNELGQVRYCISPTRIVVTWNNVGYYNTNGDLRNTFQVILTDGTDPLIGVGNNVGFVYQDMQWTTGDASQGTDGFGGIPAVVGANLGDGVSYIQIGLFDHEGDDYDGPAGNNDGVSWLDYRSFVFSTEVPDANIPPLASGNILCDTIVVCAGEVFDFNAEFYSPEPDQSTSIVVESPTLSGVLVTESTTGVIATVEGVINTVDSDVGSHQVFIIGTDDGSPSASTTVGFIVTVIPNPNEPPIIAGNNTFCDGGITFLNVVGTYDTYEWSNGSTGPNISVFESGSYTVTVTNGGQCSSTSDPFVVSTLPQPDPVITGPGFSCGGAPAILSTTVPYASYVWSNSSTEPSVSVGTGTYTVAVTNQEGCSATSAPFAVVVGSDPQASYIPNPPSPSIIGTTVQFNDASNGNGAPITDWDWDFGVGGAGSSDQDPSFTYTLPGTYVITLIVTTADGCQDTLVTSYSIVPLDVIIPNVFSPNNDGLNDTFVIENGKYFENSLTVYNRWGQAVYEAKNYKDSWRANGVPEGTYYYVFTIMNDREYTGHLTIVR